MQETTESVGHIVPAKLYVTIWAILMAMTITTVLVARADIGPFNVVVALVIATIKATLVVLFFMHLRYSPKLTMATVVAAMFFLFLLSRRATRSFVSKARHCGRSDIPLRHSNV